MTTGPIRYARAGEAHIAYQVVGDATRDVLFIPDWISNIEMFWDEPAIAR
jgi:hypothetical protein